MLRLGIDAENLYRATFICQDGLCCYGPHFFSTLSWKFGQLRRFFWANGLPPPLAKNFPYAYGPNKEFLPAPQVPSIANVVFLSLEPRAPREKVKLCKLMIKQRGEIVFPRAFALVYPLRLPLATVTQNKNKRLLVVYGLPGQVTNRCIHEYNSPTLFSFP